MNTLGRNQRELSFQQDVADQASAPQRSGDGLVAQMIFETTSAKRAWVAQLDMMMEHENRDEARETLRQIRLDELKHVRILSELPTIADIQQSTEATRPESIISYNRAARLKIKSAEFVRRIYYSFDDTGTRDALFEIICDDTNNSLRFTLMTTLAD